MPRCLRTRAVLPTLVLVLLLGAGSGQASAAPFGFAVDTARNLYNIDLGAATTTLIGNTGVFLEALGISPAGDLFGTDTGGGLWSINTATAAAAFVGATGRGNIEALDYNGATLLGVDFANTPTVFSINTTNASTTNVVTATMATGVVRSGTVRNANTMLIRGDSGCPGNCLYSLNLTTGVPTLIGGLANITAGIDFGSDGLMYGLRSNGELVRIDPNTAAEVLVGDLGNQFWLGFAAPGEQVPEPATLALMLTGLVGVTRRAWRRRR